MDTSEHHRSGGTQQRAQARRVSGLAYAATLAVFLWWFSTRLGVTAAGDAMVAVLAVLPWCALAMIAHWRGIVHADSSSVYRGVAALFHVPGLLLCIAAIADVHLLAWHEALILTALGGAPFAALALRLDRRPARKRQAVVMMALFAVAYAYGIVAQLDTRLDRAPPQRFRVTVLDKHLSGGTHSPLRRILTVEPWGPRAETDDITVDGDTFHAVKRGASVCISLHPGALGIPWYGAAACS
jgi:hypothetical protein